MGGSLRTYCSWDVGLGPNYGLRRVKAILGKPLPAHGCCADRSGMPPPGIYDPSGLRAVPIPQISWVGRTKYSLHVQRPHHAKAVAAAVADLVAVAWA